MVASDASTAVQQRLAELLRDSAADIVTQWSSDLRTPAFSGYADRPLDELESDCRLCFEGYLAVIADGDYGKLRRYLSREVRMRVAQGFRASEVARSFVHFEPVVWPLVVEGIGSESRGDLTGHDEALAAALGRVRTCVTNALLEFSDLYQTASQQRVDEYIAEMERMNRRLEELSVRDPLTGLYNRRYVGDRLAHEFQRSLRHDRPLAVLMVDIDHFKTVNDTYGHQVGDEVLRSVALMLVNQTRATDVTARYGGEEFLAVLPETDAAGAARVAEKLREAVAVAPLYRAQTPKGEQFAVHCTVSIGVAAYHPGIIDPNVIVQAADAALYAAKAAGRNRAVSAWDRPDEAATPAASTVSADRKSA
jgi:diguanylate cyclase (GGDEF)-like protein